MPGPCNGHKKHLVSPGHIHCYRCNKRVYKHPDPELQRIFNEYTKRLHPHFFIAGYCIDCGLERHNYRRPWKEFLRRYGTGYYGIPICRTKWNNL